MRRSGRRRSNPGRTTDDILKGSAVGAPWSFVEGSISVTASILTANAIARCGSWPIVGFFKNLTEQEDGVIIAGMALLFPTALVFYLGGKMVFSAYYEYKRRWEAYQEKRFEESFEEGLEEGRKAERARQKRALEERGVTLPPEAERILFGDTDDSS